MAYIAIDLGTTNIKAAIFDEELKLVYNESENVVYFRDGDIVEFDPEKYAENVFRLVRRCREFLETVDSSKHIRSITLTGQAESLVLLDSACKPLRRGISWLDMRSHSECIELQKQFNVETTYPITGQPSIIPTWPITKMLWLKSKESDTFNKVDKYLMLKDYIHFRLTGVLAGEYSIYNFTHYFDIRKKAYWFDILNYCGIKGKQLPDLTEPCSVLGSISKEASGLLGLSENTTVNIGTLDHFAGMVGTGNIREGIISESTGTVLSLATLVKEPVFSDDKIPLHYGFLKDTYVLLPVCESGGVSLEWFQKNFLSDKSFREIDDEIANRNLPNKVVFLPYITGVNAPDFDPDIRGLFYGLQVSDDAYDFAYAVIEGVTHLLKKNLDYFEKIGITTDSIISTGGGAKSKLWSQLKADILKKNIAIPANQEAACFGAAIIAAVDDGVFSNYEEAIQKCVSIKETVSPSSDSEYLKKLENKHRIFNKLVDRILPVYKDKVLD